MRNNNFIGTLLIVTLAIYACEPQKKQLPDDADFPPLASPFFVQKPPGSTPEIFAPRPITTEHEAQEKPFSPDVNAIYFRRADEELEDHALVALQYNDAQWAETFVVPHKGEISPDGTLMYIGNTYRTRNSTGWSGERSLGAPFDSIPIMRLTASAKGTYFFDTSPFYDKTDRVGTLSYSRLIDGQRQSPKTVEIEMGTRNAHPFIAPDESYLIWDGKAEAGYGKNDLYISFREQDGSWGAAINLGDTINTEHYDGSGSVTADGNYFFFYRYPDGERTKMWVDASFIEALRPKH